MKGIVYAQLLDLFLRAGGGSGGGRSSGGGSSSRSSGSSSGSSYYGGSGGSGGAGSALVGLIFGGVCLFIIIIFIILAMRASKKKGYAGMSQAGLPTDFGTAGSATGEMLGNMGPRSASRAEIDAGIVAITQRDGGFNEPDFLSDVNRAFFTIQQAWTERKPELSRQVMHDGVWQQHKFQIDQYLTGNKQNILDNLAVQNVRTVSVTTDTAFDTIIVRFFASCADYDIDLSDDKRKVLRGSRNIEDWAEDWVFQRSSKATTKPNAGTMNKKCPNCGAPLDLDLAGICKYCKAPVMSGEFDWVLTRIEQLPSYEYAQQTLPPATTPGAPPMAPGDPSQGMPGFPGFPPPAPGMPPQPGQPPQPPQQ